MDCMEVTYLDLLWGCGLETFEGVHGGVVFVFVDSSCYIMFRLVGRMGPSPKQRASK